MTTNQNMKTGQNMTTNYKQLTSSDVSWPTVNGEEITIDVLKSKGFSIINNSFRQINTPYNIHGMNVMIPVDMPIYEIRRKNLQGAILPKGGYITVKATKGKICVIGESICKKGDHFDKTVGIKIATASAVSQLRNLGAL